MLQHYDLILVGTSFASSFFLKKYLEKAGPKQRILVVERGKFLSHAQRLQYARKQPFGLNSFISELSGLEATYDNRQSSKPWIFDPNFGGSSNCWTGCTPRFLPNDFRLKSLYGVGQDWPIGYEALESYYSEAEEIMQIAGPEATPFPKSEPYPLPAHALSTVDQLLQKEFGLLYISQPTARASRPTGKRNACCTTANCHLCPINAKFTIENSLYALYADPRVEVLLEAQVTALELEGKQVTGVHIRKEEKEQLIKGQVVALGANALFNAHILLNSGDKHPLVGKGISEQLGLYAYLLLDGLDNLGGASIITANGYMLYDGPHRREHAGCIIENHNEPFIRVEAGKWRQIAKMKFVFEDLPQQENQVKTTEDPGMPQVVFNDYSAYAKSGVAYMKHNIERLFSCLPIERIEFDDFFQPSEAHILGTARMGKTAQEGVVDDRLVHHRYRNLFVLGGSAFPSITPANPTLTLSALSLRAADLSF